MKLYPIVMILICTMLASNALANNDEQEVRQKQLDDACAAAREEVLAPLRMVYVAECVEKWKKDQAYCERFYRDYGERTAVGRPAFFYDLPECVQAFEYRKYRK